MDRGSLWVTRCTKALNGTGVEPGLELLPELPPPLALLVREVDALAACDAAPVPVPPDKALELPVEEVDRADVELVPDRLLLLERLNTPEVAALREDPLLLEVGDSRLFPEELEAEPAPEEEPAVLEATVATVPLVEPWM